MTKELVYTAVTRAKEWVTVVALEDVLLQACARKVQRQSGLAERIENKEKILNSKAKMQVKTIYTQFAVEFPEGEYSLTF